MSSFFSPGACQQGKESAQQGQAHREISRHGTGLDTDYANDIMIDLNTRTPQQGRQKTGIEGRRRSKQRTDRRAGTPADE